MRRRRLLGVVATIAVAGWAPWAPAWARPQDTRSLLLAVLRRRVSAASIGRAYLAGHPTEARADRLAWSLADRLTCRGCDPRTTGRAQLRAALAREVRRDFAERRVVTVEGWVLSRTEARLCALAALA